MKVLNGRMDNDKILVDHTKAKNDVLNSLLISGSRQLEESNKNLEGIKSILAWAKNPKERTALNVIFDDQRKVIKALERFVADVSEMI
jgi:hypothetical protein